MLHGNPTWSFYYRNVIKTLSSDFRCLALDHLGCGLSDKPQNYVYSLNHHIENATAWIDRLQIDRFDLIVHDWGGAIGMGLARKYPDRIRKLVILNTAAFIDSRIPFRIRLCRIPVLGELIVRGFNGFARPALSMAVEKRLSNTVKAGYLLPYNSWNNRIANLRFVQDIPTKPGQETYQLIEKIEAFLPNLANRPTLLGWGLKDFCFTKRFLDRWQAIFPDAKTAAYPNSGHYILEDEMEALTSEIQKFLVE